MQVARSLVNLQKVKRKCEQYCQRIVSRLACYFMAEAFTVGA